MTHKQGPAFAWGGHCVYGDEASVRAVHATVTEIDRLRADLFLAQQEASNRETALFSLVENVHKPQMANAEAEIDQLTAALRAVQQWSETLPNAAGIPGFPKDDVDAALMEGKK